VNGAGDIAASMAKNGWVGAPVDVVSVGGRLVTVDNTRVLAAHMTGTPVQVLIHGAGEALPASMAGRFGAATTWGEAVMARIAGQNAAYRASNPLGSWFIGVAP
jgi:filamentous hemagglutinin